MVNVIQVSFLFENVSFYNGVIVHATLFYQSHIVVFKSRFTVFGNVMGKENVLMLLKWCRTVKLILMIVS